MDQLESTGAKLEESLAQDNLEDLIADLGDLTLDQISTVGENIPVFSYIFKGIKGYNAVKDLFFMKKVIKYLSEVACLPVEERRKIIEEFDIDNEYEQKFGEHALIVLDRFDHHSKATYLGRGFKYLAAGHITQDFYLKFATILDRMFLSDLNHILRSDSSWSYDRYNLSPRSVTVNNLESLGLVRLELDTKNIFEKVLNPRHGIRPSSSDYMLSRGQHSRYRITEAGNVFANIIKGDKINAHWGGDNLEEYLAHRRL